MDIGREIAARNPVDNRIILRPIGNTNLNKQLLALKLHIVVCAVLVVEFQRHVRGDCRTDFQLLRVARKSVNGKAVHDNVGVRDTDSVARNAQNLCLLSREEGFHSVGYRIHKSPPYCSIMLKAIVLMPFLRL